MNVSMNVGMYSQMPNHPPPPPPPNSEDLAARMSDAVSEGDIDIEQLQAHLSHLGIADSSAIVADDGSVDQAELASLLEANKPDGPGGPGGPPPPPPGHDGSDIDLLLSEILGEEGLDEVTEEDGSYDIDALLTALREQLEADDETTSGNLLDLVA